MISREKYLEQIRPFYDSDLIKIITGIRRCGKSVILNQIYEEISKKTTNTIQLDFEDLGVLSEISSAKDLVNYVEGKRKKSELCYVFLDEIQKLTDWNVACRTLRLRKCSVFISGSNSKLLSKEFTKELSGRYVSFRIRPFVYRELQNYANLLNYPLNINDYIVWGGFPKRIEYPKNQDQKSYLNDLNETIILNDLMNRYKIRKESLFRQLVNYVLISNSRILSIRSLYKYIKSSTISCSITTITNYIEYLKEAYVISTIKKYSVKSKRELEYYMKIYNEDVSLNSIRVTDKFYDITHNFENIVYNELLYRGYTLGVYVDPSYEIDFIASKEGKQYLIQVAYSVADRSTYERELKPFSKIDNTYQKILITNDDMDLTTSTVRHIQFKDFILMDEL